MRVDVGDPIGNVHRTATDIEHPTADGQMTPDGPRHEVVTHLVTVPVIGTPLLEFFLYRRDALVVMPCVDIGADASEPVVLAACPAQPGAPITHILTEPVSDHSQTGQGS